MTTVTFHGGPIDGEVRAIDNDDQMDYRCYVNKGDWVSQQVYRRRDSDPTILDYVEGQVRFIVETDQPDEDGTTIDLAGIVIKDKIPVLMNFRRNTIVTSSKVWVAGGLLMCEAMLEDRYLDYNPAIGFSVVKWHEIDGKRHYLQIRLDAIGLCEKPNLNPKIKTIREQIKEQA